MKQLEDQFNTKNSPICSFSASLFSRLTPHTLILTANKRLSTKITALFHDAQYSKHLEAWPRLNIMPLVTWLQQCWENSEAKGLNPALTLLTTQQEQLLWQKIIKKMSHDVLLQIPNTAASAQQAWRLIKEWTLSLDDSRLNETVDSAQFIKWAKEFKKECMQNNWLDQPSLPEQLQHHFQNQALTPPKDILLVGFVEITPHITRLLNALEKQGVQIEFFEHPLSTNETTSIAFPHHESEIYAMARWAKQRLIENKEEEKLSVACIIPELNTFRNELERIFSTVFNHEPLLPPVFNISSGNALFDEPLIHTAFSILNLKEPLSSFEELSTILTSPFIQSAEEELHERALLDYNLRETNNTHWFLDFLIEFTTQEEKKKSPTVYCPKLITSLRAFHSHSSEPNQILSRWCKTFTEELAAIGWPGERALNSREYQTIQRWMSMLTEFASLELITNACSRSHALLILKQLAGQIIFQPQTTDHPIQILGILEATGMPFSHIWMMGLNDRAWPPQANPNPFLPASLQRELNLPHSSAKRELEFSTLLTEQFIQQSSQTILSYAKQQENQHLHASPLLQKTKKISLNQLDLAPFELIERTLIRHHSLDMFRDDQAPSIGEKETPRGGTGIFKQQSACPFRAFAEFRLHSKPINKPEIGITALERGLLLHQTLEFFWRKVKSQTNLLALTDSEVNRLIAQYSAISASKLFSKRYLSESLVQLEKTRLRKLLRQWIVIEKARDPFEVIAIETWRRITMGPLTIRGQIDRIDRLQNGDLLLIDYKTGKTSPYAWLDSRPDEPQLPLYAISGTEPISSISFAQIRTDEMCFKTIGKEKDHLPNAKSISDSLDWSQQLSEWQETLKNLANDFYYGDAKVDPKYGRQTCQNCHLQTLCRIYEE